MARAGNRRHIVQVQAKTTDRDALGGAAQAWSTQFSTRVGITPLSGRELLAAQAIHAEASHRIEGVFRPEWADPVRAAGYRILFGTRIFNIHDVQNVEERNRDIEIVASEGMNEG
jgi:SPP1 family predicted phage head-tail adaptor